MKLNLKLFQIAFVVMLLVSCNAKTYYQIYKTSTSDNITLKDNNLVYEDDNCRVYYDLWSEGGNIGFKFFNKTTKNIYLNLEESFLLVNGIANNYFKNRTYSSSKTSNMLTSFGVSSYKSITGLNYFDNIQSNQLSISGSVGAMNSNSFSVGYIEEKIVIIPSNSSKIISEYIINQTLYRDCDLYKYPTKKQMKPKLFTKTESPLVFSNRIAYRIGDSEKLVKFENEFYVSEVNNLPESEVLEYKTEEYCGQKGSKMVEHYKNIAPNKFYIKYKKGNDTWRH